MVHLPPTHTRTMITEDLAMPTPLLDSVLAAPDGETTLKPAAPPCEASDAQFQKTTELPAHPWPW